MAFASAVLMFAGSPQMFLGVASSQDSLFLFIDVVSVYGRYVSSEIARTLVRILCGLKNSANKRHKVTQRFVMLGFKGAT